LRDESYKDEEEHGGDGDGEEEHSDEEHGGAGGTEGDGGEGEGDGGEEEVYRPRTEEVGDDAVELSKEKFEPMKADMSEVIMDRLKVNGCISDSDDGTYKALTTAHDKLHHRTDSNDKYNFTGGQWLKMGDAGDYDYIMMKMAGYINVMRRKLERAILSKANRDWETGKEDGRIDSKRLVSAVAGRVDVFKDRIDQPEMDTALSVLVDLSGSMYGQPAEVASECVVAIAESLDRTGVAYEILGFNSQSSQEAKLAPKISRAESEGSDLRWSRYEPIDIWEFKRFSDRLFEAKGSISQLKECVGGNNVDGESVMIAFKRLKQRPEKRKILMVFSDGQPAAHSDSPSMLRVHLKKVVRTILKSGVECIGIGILSDAVKRYYPTYVVVDSLEDLATNVMEQLSQALMGKRFNLRDTGS
jgi:cobaltochelatase CobT subunit